MEDAEKGNELNITVLSGLFFKVMHYCIIYYPILTAGGSFGNSYSLHTHSHISILCPFPLAERQYIF